MLYINIDFVCWAMWKVKEITIKERGRKGVQKGENIERVHIGAELRHVSRIVVE